MRIAQKLTSRTRKNTANHIFYQFEMAKFKEKNIFIAIQRLHIKM